MLQRIKDWFMTMALLWFAPTDKEIYDPTQDEWD